MCMKVLITGADGFLGSNTARYLKEKGHDVTSFTQDVRRNLPYERFDCLYHFAAFVRGRKGIDNNKWLVTENIEIDRITFKWADEFCKKIEFLICHILIFATFCFFDLCHNLIFDF